LLSGADMCEGSLPLPPATPIMAASLLLVLNIQQDNACFDNKN
jgi:hypothetical protein